MYKAIVVHFKMKKGFNNIENGIYFVPYYNVEISYSGNQVIFKEEKTITFSEMDLIELIDIFPTEEKIRKCDER